MTEREALKLALEALEKMEARFGDTTFRHEIQPSTYGCHHISETCPLCEGLVTGWKAVRTANQAITFIKEALNSPDGEAQPEHSAPHGEPVAWRNAAIRVGEDLCSVGPFGYYDMTAEQWLDWALSVVTVHAPPPQRPSRSDMTWVGLTPQERDEINEQVYGAVPHHVAFHAAIEAKLREKNSL